MTVPQNSTRDSTRRRGPKSLAFPSLPFNSFSPLSDLTDQVKSLSEAATSNEEFTVLEARRILLSRFLRFRGADHGHRRRQDSTGRYSDSTCRCGYRLSPGGATRNRHWHCRNRCCSDGLAASSRFVLTGRATSVVAPHAGPSTSDHRRDQPTACAIHALDHAGASHACTYCLSHPSRLRGRQASGRRQEGFFGSPMTGSAGRFKRISTFAASRFRSIVRIRLAVSLAVGRAKSLAPTFVCVEVVNDTFEGELPAV